MLIDGFVKGSKWGILRFDHRFEENMPLHSYSCDAMLVFASKGRCIGPLKIARLEWTRDEIRRISWARSTS